MLHVLLYICVYNFFFIIILPKKRKEKRDQYVYICVIGQHLSLSQINSKEIIKKIIIKTAGQLLIYMQTVLFLPRIFSDLDC